MNPVKIQIGSIGIGIGIFVYVFEYILQNTDNVNLFTKPPDMVGIGLAGVGLAIIIGIVVSIIYMVITHMMEEYGEWERNKNRQQIN